MRKPISLALVFVFSWLQTYQLCDASEDAAEAAANYAQVISHKTDGWKTPAAPDDDDDGAIPLVMGQTLIHGSVSFEGPVAEYPLVPFSLHPLQMVLMVPLLQDRSPPDAQGFPACPRVSSLVIDRRPAHSLAPPLV